MEKYFIVTEQSRLHKDYWNYKNNIPIVGDLIKQLMDKYNIETEWYYANNESFAIEPTEKDVEMFDKMLKKPVENGIRFFKKNSKVNKDWLKLLETSNVKVLHKPILAFYIEGIYGKFRTRLFDINEIIYCSISVNIEEIKCPEGFVEIKASEFYKIIEDSENK